MKKSTLVFLIVSLAAVLVLLLERPWLPKEGDALSLFPFEKLDTTAVARVEIEQILDGVQLKKEEGKWWVAELKTKLKKELEKQETKNQVPSTKNQELIWFPADAKRVDMSLATISEMEVISLAGRNRERHGFFEVNPVGMQVRLFDAEGNKLAHLYIGKTGPAFTESYVRKEGEDEVYIANRYLRSSFPPVVNDWEEKKTENNQTDVKK